MILPVEFGFPLISVACMCVIVCCCKRLISGPCQAKGYLSRRSKQKKRAERLANAACKHGLSIIEFGVELYMNSWLM